MSNSITLCPNSQHLDNVRIKRYKRQDTSAQLAVDFNTGHAVKYCLRRVQKINVGKLFSPAGLTTNQVSLQYSLRYRRAHYKNLQTCGSAWDCPVCSAKLARVKGEYIRQGGKHWAESGGTMFMMTFTLAHAYDDKLSDIVRVMNGALRFVKSGAPWQRKQEEYQIKGSIVSTETTFTYKNGFHFHKHILCFTTLPEGSKLEELQKWLYNRYLKKIEKSGFYADELHGVKVDDEVISSSKSMELYFAKWGLDDELTSSESKTSITPFDLLDEPKYYHKFVEYSKALFKINRLRWSKGLYDLLGVRELLTDEEIVQDLPDLLISSEEVIPVIKGTNSIEIWGIDSEIWKLIVKNKDRAEVCNRAEQPHFTEWLHDNYYLLDTDSIPASLISFDLWKSGLDQLSPGQTQLKK